MNITNINNCSTIEQQPNSLESTPIMVLPNEIIEKIILLGLDEPEIVHARRICTRFLEVIDNKQGLLSLIKRIYKYKKLYSEQPQQVNNIVIDNYQLRFNQWLKSLSISEFKHSKHIINKFNIHEQYYNLARLISCNNNYTFNETEQFTADVCFQKYNQYQRRFFSGFHLTNDQHTYFITATTDKSYLLFSMIDNIVKELYGHMHRSFYHGMFFLSDDTKIIKFFLVDDFIIYLVDKGSYHELNIIKKINGVYTKITDLTYLLRDHANISYLGKKDDKINFLIQRGTSLYIYEENKNEDILKGKFWHVTEIVNYDYDIITTTSENGLIITKIAGSCYDAGQIIHLYKYSEKIATIYLTDEEQQKKCFFDNVFACNNNGTSFAIKKCDKKRNSHFSVYKIQDNKIEISYTLNHKKINNIIGIQYSPCGNFIEVTHGENIQSNKKNVYSILHDTNYLESNTSYDKFSMLANIFNSTGFLYAEYIKIRNKNMIKIYSCINKEMQIKAIINCTNTILKVLFSPNSQLVATMEKTTTNEVVIKVYLIFKLQQNDNIEFSKSFPTEALAEIKAEEISDFKFHPDGFKIIVITEKSIKIFSLITTD